MSVETRFSTFLTHGMRQIVYWSLQPILIAASLYLAHTNASLDTHILFITAAFCIITLFEITIPARPEWQKSSDETVALSVFVILAGAAYALIETLYEASLFKWMASLSEAWQLDIWPSQ